MEKSKHDIDGNSQVLLDYNALDYNALDYNALDYNALD